MKNSVSLVLGIFLVSSLISPLVSATTVNSDLLTRAQTPVPNFNLQTFKSCADMRTKIADFMDQYYDKYPPYNYGGVIYDKRE